MSRSKNPSRQGTGAMNLDSKGRVQKFNKNKKDIYNTFRRKSNGGMGG